MCVWRFNFVTLILFEKSVTKNYLTTGWKDRRKEWRMEEMTEWQGKSSIAPLFQSWAIINTTIVLPYLLGKDEAFISSNIYNKWLCYVNVCIIRSFPYRRYKHSLVCVKIVSVNSSKSIFYEDSMVKWSNVKFFQALCDRTDKSKILKLVGA